MEILFGGLISILTLIVAKYFELQQKKLEHNYSLESLFFSKKLEAAETAIMNFSDELSFLNQHLVINEKLVEVKLEDYPFLLKQREFVNQDFSEDSKSIEKSVGKIYLYFDIESYIFSDNANYKKFIEITSELDKIDSEMKIQTNMFQYFKDNKTAQDTIYANIVDKAKDYIPKIKEMIALLTKAREEVFQNIIVIKNQMKKYNPK
ncbi:MAG: hypothetical protein STSR0008_23850 [Ignavibacterium sp.]